MQQRLNITQVAPAGYKPLQDLELYLHQSGIEPNLLLLIKLRASQINGCAYCIDMHWKDLRASGETEQRLYGLDAWRESPYYTDRERAAFEWTEALTLIWQNHVPDDVYEVVRKQFSEKETADLTYAVAAINAWNRIATSLRAPAGTYKPGLHELRKSA